MSSGKYRVKVHKKGLIVIPADVRRKLGIYEGSHLELVLTGDGIHLLVPRSLLDSFGADGEKAIEVAKLIGASRREEVEKEVRA